MGGLLLLPCWHRPRVATQALRK